MVRSVGRSVDPKSYARVEAFSGMGMIINGVLAAVVAVVPATGIGAVQAQASEPLPAVDTGTAIKTGAPDWGRHRDGYDIIVSNVDASVDAQYVPQWLGAVLPIDPRYFPKDGILHPHSWGHLKGGESLLDAGPADVDFELVMKERTYHATIRRTSNGRIKPTCAVDDAAATCRWEGVDSNGTIRPSLDALRLTIAYYIERPN